MGRVRNPFIFGRIEFEKNVILYMPKEIQDWISRKPQIFEGPRGSGKSSILKSLSWEVAWKVSDITIKGPQEVVDIFDKPMHLGVYYRVEDMDVELWERWKETCGINCAQRYFATYLDFLYLDLFLNAMISLRKNQYKFFSNSDSERAMVKEILKQIFSEKELRCQFSEDSFFELHSTVQDIHLGIRESVYKNIPESVMKETYPVVGPGNLIKAFGEAFVKYFTELNEWTLMALLDDCNQLTDWQTIVVNSAIAKAKKPIAYKLTSVRGLYKTRKTLNRTRNLIEHDMDTILVPSIKPTDETYLELVEGVCRSRIEQQYSKNIADKFDFKDFLGSFQLEDLIFEKIKRSEKREALDLLSAKTKQKTSIISTWLSQKQIRSEQDSSFSAPDVARIQKRQDDSKYWKKWRYVAAIALCKEFKLEFPYCGWKIIAHLSCGSIRELLRIMSMIWSLSQLNINEFVKQRPIDKTIQTRAIIETSKKSFEAIDKNPLFNKVTLAKTCERLGMLFSECQSYPYILKTPETAAVSIKRSELKEDIENIVNEAVMSGIMLKKEHNGKIIIGLNPILAPKFSISFRSPFYYPESIASKALVSLFSDSDEVAEKIIKLILANRLKKSSKNMDSDLQFELF